MEIRFFRINDLKDIGTGKEVYLDTSELNVIPFVHSYVSLFDSFPRKVATLNYCYDKDGVGVEVFLYTNLEFENKDGEKKKDDE